MSDQSVPAAESDVEPVATKSGLFKGDDGKLSGRKLRTNLAYVAGVVFLAIGMFRGGTWLERIVAGAVCFVYALIESGLLTWQNISGIVASWKGVSG
jgi:hypothetical protein